MAVIRYGVFLFEIIEQANENVYHGLLFVLR
nr:MAG TPA: hypothetical protein [Caudoviricetes sp.]